MPIIDILRSDGALVTADGRLIRAATNAAVGSEADAFVQLMQARTASDVDAGIVHPAQMRVGTLLFDRDEVAISLLDCIRAQGLSFDPATGLVAQNDGPPGPLPWFGQVPCPEDYVLARSGTTLAEINGAVEWDARRPSGAPTARHS